MSKKLKVFSFPDRNPEYLQLQINSYNKYIKNNDNEFIIINASINNEDEINQICKNNNIQCIKYTGSKNVQWADYYIEQLHWFREEIQKKSNDYILLIHSDMFFINTLNFKDLMSKKEIYYVPQYRNEHSGYPGSDYSYIWDGIILFNSQYFNENDLTKYFNWHYIRPITDGGGMMKDFLNIIKPRNIHNYFEFWNYISTDENNFHQWKINENIIDTHLNGNIRYFINKDNNEFIGKQPLLGNKSFEYENEKLNYKEYYIEKIIKIKKTFIDPYDFPSPAFIDVIQIFEEDIIQSFMLHFKTGVGFQPFYNNHHCQKKLEEIEKIINRGSK